MMGELLANIASTFLQTVFDVAPIVIMLVFFQLIVLREKLPNPKKLALGFTYVIAGLALFLIGLDEALFPLGDIMAAQLTDPKFILGDAFIEGLQIHWWQYYWIYIFAAAIGFATTVAEPALIAVSMKASEASGGTLQPWPLRIAVAVGVSAAIALGAFRIITGTSLAYYMMAGYLIVMVQTMFAPKKIIPLAFDSGGVTTSTVTVPLVTALGLGLASTVPGRSPLLDGFGLIALASLFPMITVMGYASIAERLNKVKENTDAHPDPRGD